MFTLILGREDSFMVNESMLAILYIFHGLHSQVRSFRYVEAIARGIMDQLTKFHTEKLFCYPSYLVYLLIFHQ